MSVRILIICVVATLFLAGCNSTKQVTNHSTSDLITQSEQNTKQTTEQKDSTREESAGTAEQVVIREIVHDTVERVITLNNIRWVKNTEGLNLTSIDTKLEYNGTVTESVKTDIQEVKESKSVIDFDKIWKVAVVILILFFAVKFIAGRLK